MTPESPIPNNPEGNPNLSRIQAAAIDGICSCSTTSRWDPEILTLLAADYVKALTHIDTLCDGKWRGVKVITEEVEIDFRTRTRRTLVVPSGEPHNPYFDLETIVEKPYLGAIKKPRQGIKNSFTNALNALAEGKTVDEIRRLREKRFTRKPGVMDGSRGSRSSNGTYADSDNNSH